MFASIQISSKPLLTLSSKTSDYRGQCSYKTGKCLNERSLKIHGGTHSLCEDHRKIHNKNQRKRDQKRRDLKRKMAPMENPLWSPIVVEKDGHWQWSVEEVQFLQTILLEDPKRRGLKRKMAPQSSQHTRPSISLSSSMSPSMDNLLWSPMASLNGDVVEKDDHWQWSVEEVNFLQTIML